MEKQETSDFKALEEQRAHNTTKSEKNDCEPKEQGTKLSEQEAQQRAKELMDTLQMSFELVRRMAEDMRGLSERVSILENIVSLQSGKLNIDKSKTYIG
jgi:hypothetical protein